MTWSKQNTKANNVKYSNTKLPWFSHLLWQETRRACSTTIPSPHGARDIYLPIMYVEELTHNSHFYSVFHTEDHLIQKQTF